MLMLSGADLTEVIPKIAQPPKRLYISSDNWPDLLARPRIAIVGSRKVSPYGRAVTANIATDLARSGIVIVSGLALGVDAIAHRTALEAGGLTVAVLPRGLDTIYPASHRQLAESIVKRGGALITEYAPGTALYPVNFIARNRLVSAFSTAILITEATEKSGTLHTARFALEQGKDILAIPGNITSPTSVGTNNLIKAGATAITSSDDVFRYLGIAPAVTRVPRGDTSEEQLILDSIAAGISDGTALLHTTRLEAAIFNQALTMLEITGKIRPLGANHWTLS